MLYLTYNGMTSEFVILDRQNLIVLQLLLYFMYSNDSVIL